MIMMAITKKASKVLFRGAAIALATKAGLYILRKINSDGKLESKANASIDKNAEVAKRLVKVGVAKSLQMTEVAQEKLESKKIEATK